jgi:hypothetical protein
VLCDGVLVGALCGAMKGCGACSVLSDAVWIADVVHGVPGVHDVLCTVVCSVMQFMHMLCWC